MHVLLRIYKHHATLRVCDSTPYLADVGTSPRLWSKHKPSQLCRHVSRTQITYTYRPRTEVALLMSL
jgi:hypothetical protein